MHGKAKEQAEIDSEKEIVEISTVQAMGKNKRGIVTQSKLQENLDSNAGGGKTEVIEDEDNIVVKFIDSGRYYEVDSDGNVGEPITVIVDNYAGDLTKGGKYDGSSEENAFQINCIEDLVSFSQEVSLGNNYNGKYIVITKSLDFSSIFSYADYKTTTYDKYLGGDGTVGLKEQLKKNGFNPVGKYSQNFSGIFNGNNYEIKNIYEDITSSGGLFGYVSNAIIKNVKISGEITSTSYTGGIVGCILGNSSFINIESNVNVTGTEAGGIIGNNNGQLTDVNNCINYGKVKGKGASGGICGDKFYGNIINCINYGEITADNSTNYGVGGIVGNNNNLSNIYNCFNYGKISYTGNRGTWYFGGTGGIIGLNRNVLNKIINCVNLGEISSTSYSGGICGMDIYYWSKNIEFDGTNLYFLKQDNLKAVGSMESTIVESFELKNLDSIVNTINSYIDNNKESIPDWKRWMIGEDGFLKFE